MRRRKSISNPSNSGSVADIAFLLLIFFMVATSLQREKSIPMKLPPAYDGPSGQAPDSRVLSIDINANNEILIEDQESQLESAKQIIVTELETMLKNSKKPIISLRIHQDANFQSYMTLLSIVKNAIKYTKENKALELYNTPLLQLSKSNYAQLNKSIGITISEIEYKV